MARPAAESADSGSRSALVARLSGWPVTISAAQFPRRARRANWGSTPDTHRDGDAGRADGDHRGALGPNRTPTAARGGPFDALALLVVVPRQLVVQRVAPDARRAGRSVRISWSSSNASSVAMTLSVTPQSTHQRRG